MKKVIREGEMIPRGYGIAYREMERLCAVAYPIPINVIVGYLRKFWIYLKTDMAYVEDIRTKAYGLGYSEGYERGKSEATKAVLAQAQDYFVALNKEIKRVFPKVRKPLSKLPLLKQK